MTETPTTMQVRSNKTAPRSNPAAPQAALATKLDVTHLPNAFRIHPKVISGGLPEGGPAFSELRELGVKTVISVDGGKPDVALAKKFGMRYVHLPHGYDGVPEAQGALLAKAVRDLPGPIYIHCHHGKHRSPAASAVACVAAGLITAESALGILKTAGTSENYRGLYDSATSARRLEDPILDKLPANFPEIAKLPLLAQVMVAVEHTHDHLKQIAAAGWESPPNHPAINPAHEALLIREHMTELLRTEDTRQRPQSYRQYLQASEAAGLKLEADLREWAKEEIKAAPPKTLDESFFVITKNCGACHREHRDIPLREKQSSR